MESKRDCSRHFSLVNSWATPGPLNTILLSTFILVEIIVKCIKSSCYLVLDLGRASWPRGGMVTRRIANPCIPVRFWAWPPKKILSCNKKKVSLTNNTFLGSSVGRAVDC